MDIPKYISHLFFDGYKWHFQSNEEHCHGTSILTEELTSKFGMGEWGKIIGLLHDKGKEKEGFQAHIRKTSGLDGNVNSDQPSTHSIYGARLVHENISEDSCYWLSNPIAGHHRGLYDSMELEKKLKDDLKENLLIPKQQQLQVPCSFKKLRFSDSNHITRMLFSCLVDADRLDTERFMSPQKVELRNKFSTLSDLLPILNNFISSTYSNLPKNSLNAIRNEIQKICQDVGCMNSCFYELTVPTGGGKTIASLLWALNYAIRYDKDRIIIAIPFTSIITQTAAILKKIFGDNNVIEHHSAHNDSTVDEKAMLAIENWDAPIIVTTNVQLFESIHSNKPSKCRKLHSLVNSIVILDEVQTIPLTFLQPIVDSMHSYSRLFGTTFLFSTATQPILSGSHKGTSNSLFTGIAKKDIVSIIPYEMGLHSKLRRVKLCFLPERQDYNTIAQHISERHRILCIVNTRKDALEIYNSLPDKTYCFHLSRYMCSAHILEKIREIKNCLKNTDNPVKVVSTQLIEAGVDIDFPIVYRQLCGLDSILQAAGRCNREGNQTMATTTIFSLLKDSTMGYIRYATDTMKDLLSLYPEADWFDPKMITLYYQHLFSRTPSFDKYNIGALLNHPQHVFFQEASERFKLIDEEGIKIIVNFGKAEELIDRLKRFGPDRQLSRELGKYSVTVPIRIFKSFEKGGLINQPWKGYFYLPQETQYDHQTGLKLENSYLEQNLIF